jgi:hypothetical protein
MILPRQAFLEIPHLREARTKCAAYRPGREPGNGRSFAMPMRDEISTQPLSKHGKRVAKSAGSSISVLIGDPDFVALSVFVVIVLLLTSLWLTMFPFSDAIVAF